MEADAFAAHCGIKLVDMAPGQATATMVVQPLHLNGLGGLHGGAIFTLADFAFAAACNSHGPAAVALNVNITFIKAVTTGLLRAEARETSLSHRLGTYSIQVTNEQGELVAAFQGLAYRKTTG